MLKLFLLKEILTENENFNEYILTRLRTKWGVSGQFIEQNFGKDKLNYFYHESEKFLKLNWITEQNGIFILTHEGKLVSDKIMSGLMFI